MRVEGKGRREHKRNQGGGWGLAFSDSRIRGHDKKLNREPECGE